MNIFLTSPDPRECAQALDDKRVNKMAVETAQLLATALRGLGVHDVSYKATHTAHPCSKWAARRRANFLWLVEHGLELCSEFEFRYDHRRVHASKAAIEEAYQHSRVIPDGEPLTFDFNSSGFDTGDVFFDYRLCLLSKWRDKDGYGGATGNSLRSRKPSWTYRGPPPWKRQMWAYNLNDYPPYNLKDS